MTIKLKLFVTTILLILLVTPSLAQIEYVALTQDDNYTGRGNANEVILRAKVKSNYEKPVALENVEINVSASTNVKDIKSIKVYSTGDVEYYDFRDVSSATLLGECKSKPKDVKCKLTGDLLPGLNYLWITFDISDKAKEGNSVDAELVSLSTKKEKFKPEFTNPEGERTILITRKVLYAPGDFGSKNYRIPAIITAKDGSLVIATDKRKNNQIDLPHDIDILVNRSVDGGKTWSEYVTIAEGKGYEKGFGDAALVHTNEEGGLLAIFVGGQGLWQSTPSNPNRTYISKSLDNGITWSEPRDITAMLFGEECAVEERKNWYASFCASGNGLLTKNGRIMFVSAVRENSGGTLSNYVFYSDDNGDTWNVSERAMLGGDEAKVTELNDGTILMSIRRQSKGARYYTTSKDNGITWGEVSSWEDLIEPNCNGDIIRYSSKLNGGKKNILLHTIPNHNRNRENVSIFLSYDEGKTWTVKKTLCKRGSAYSSITVLPDGTIGAYIEEEQMPGGYSLVYVNFSLKWINSTKKTQ
ncbi:sialidase-1 [Dysgonomonadaceae bacterium PH5-43]|nr:sialidase-1 [Dysgonomonadaceae bacterium PH5-43]